MGHSKIKGVFLANPDGFRIRYVFGSGRRERYERILDLCPELICRDNLQKYRDFLRETEIMIATWEMPRLSEAEIAEYFPNLKLLIYVAGSVQKFARAYLHRGVRIASAWGVMSIPVAEWTVSAIIHANKGFYRSLAVYQEKEYDEAHWQILKKFPGTYHTKVGILGAGMIGSRVIEMLREYDAEIMVFDPFLSEEKAKRLRIEQTYSLEEIFSECQTISNHLANNPQTVHMLDYSLFSRMKPNAAFINSGRGAQKHFLAEQIRLLSPFWRGDLQKEEIGRPFRRIVSLLQKEAERRGMTYIDGEKVSPHCNDLYWDERLHPNDIGFAVICEALRTRIL